MAHDVFISHSSKDKSIADAVCASLEAAKIRCWIAPRDILPGDKWAGAITKAISNSRIMVLIFSEHSNNSDDVLNELLLAKDAGAVIIPFKIGDIIPKGEMEYYLKRTHWLDAMNPPTEKQIQRLVETIGNFSISESPGSVDRGEEEKLIKERGANKKLRIEDDERLRLERKPKPSGGQWFFSLIIIFGLLALGWYVTQDNNGTKVSENQTLITTPTTSKEIPSIISTSSSIVTPASEQKTYTNSIGMEFVLIPAGEFDMGSPSNDSRGYDSERPVHHVKISNAFYMGKYEVTQKQWRDIMGGTPLSFKGDDLPLEQVSWNDFQDFIKKLNEKEGGGKYRLPTETEWEYAARAGTTTRYSFGDDESILGDYAWYEVNSEDKKHSVGQKKPNPWDLYDMHGNAWEWVQDNWHSDYKGAPTDGSSWENGSYRVIRGGRWSSSARNCRSADRDYLGPEEGYNYIGFRLIRIL